MSSTRAIRSPSRRSRTASTPPPTAGELLALATCYCNDLYREAAAKGITVRAVEVEVEAEFGGIGEPARQIRCRAKVSADTPEEALQELVEHTDRVAEVHNTLRAAIPAKLENPEIVSARPAR